MRILYSSIFARRFKKLDLEIRRLAEERENIFRENPFDARLKTHKLHGRFHDFWAFSVSGTVRIIFKFEEEQTALFYHIGDHDIYD